MKKSKKDMNMLTKCFIKDADCVTREIAGETIIVPVRHNVGDLDSIYTLNEIGTMIWQLIDCKNSINQIIEGICMAYDVSPEIAEKDTIDFLNTLKISGLIRLNIED
jgi:hypothetical protein